MNDDVKQFVLAVGALAETLRVFRTELLKNGFSRAETMELTKTYLQQTLASANSNNKEEK
jgi:hypothetical protein